MVVVVSCSALCFGWSGEHGAVGFIAREDLRRAGWEIVAVKKKAKKKKEIVVDDDEARYEEQGG
jgi:hypothetical protein